MRFPDELWDNPSERAIIQQFVDAFAAYPLVLTDKLANTIYFNQSAESLFQDHAEAIVNRLSFSLLGFGRKETVPPGLISALLGEGAPWRGVVNIADADSPRHLFIEASAIRTREKLLCGVVRFNSSPAHDQ